MVIKIAPLPDIINIIFVQLLEFWRYMWLFMAHGCWGGLNATFIGFSDISEHVLSSERLSISNIKHGGPSEADLGSNFNLMVC